MKKLLERLLSLSLLLALGAPIFIGAMEVDDEEEVPMRLQELEELYADPTGLTQFLPPQLRQEVAQYRQAQPYFDDPEVEIWLLQQTYSSLLQQTFQSIRNISDLEHLLKDDLRYIDEFIAISQDQALISLPGQLAIYNFKTNTILEKFPIQSYKIIFDRLRNIAQKKWNITRNKNNKRFTIDAFNLVVHPHSVTEYTGPVQIDPAFNYAYILLQGHLYRTPLKKVVFTNLLKKLTQAQLNLITYIYEKRDDKAPLYEEQQVLFLSLPQALQDALQPFIDFQYQLNQEQADLIKEIGDMRQAGQDIIELTQEQRDIFETLPENMRVTVSEFVK